MTREEKIQVEITRCKADFLYFCLKYLWIIDKRGKRVRLNLNRAQRRWYAKYLENSWTYVLKSRKLGISTAVAAVGLHQAMFHGKNVLVQSLDRISARTIFKIYQFFYKNLPSWMTDEVGWCLPLVRNKTEIEFKGGGYVGSLTAGSGGESARGGTPHVIHLSEFAQYAYIDEVLASVMNSAGDDPIVTLETTARGLNRAYQMWNESSSWSKVFISWMEDPDTYSSRQRPDQVPVEIKQLAKEFGLTKGQVYWACEVLDKKCGGSWNTFRQEHPVTPEMAFISSGSRFFTSHLFPQVRPSYGYTRWEEPKKYRVYSLGCDVATGMPDGDMSAFKLTDVTEAGNIHEVSAYYGIVSVHDFAALVLQEAKEYEAIITWEANGVGAALTSYLIDDGYSNLYTRVSRDRVSNQVMSKVGFHSGSVSADGNRFSASSERMVLLSRLQRLFSRDEYHIQDPCLKHEINTFVHDNKGRPGADQGSHDDMIFATGLSIMGADQIDYVQETRWRRKPDGIREQLEWEAQTGLMYEDGLSRWGEGNWPHLDEPPSSQVH